VKDNAIFTRMAYFRYFFILLYRIWFYILLGLPIIIMLPYLVAVTLSERTYHLFYGAARVWATIIIYGMGFMPRSRWQQKMQKGKSYMIVANHTSMTDIMTMLWLSPNPFVFVGKQELSKIPLFGFFYKRTNILVDRSNAQSRKAVFDQASNRLNQGISICIFPEGGVPDYDIMLDTFKDGAFRLAIEHQIPIVPIVLYDNKQRLPYKFNIGSPGRLRMSVEKFISTDGLELPKDRAPLRNELRHIILNRLEQEQK